MGSVEIVLLSSAKFVTAFKIDKDAVVLQHFPTSEVHKYYDILLKSSRLELLLYFHCKDHLA